MLEPLGIDTISESVYLAMLRSPDAGVEELAAMLSVDEGAIRAALDDLARKSLLRTSWSDPDALRPVSPEVGLAALLAREQADLARRHQRVEESRAAVAELLASQIELRQDARDPEVERLTGVEEVRDRLVSLAESCREESCTFAPTGAISAAGLVASRPIDAALLKRGVRMRSIYLDSIRNNTDSWAHLQWLRDNGAEIRTAATLPVRLHIVDRRYALVPVRNTPRGSGAILLSGEGIVAALMTLFNHLWREAAPLGAKRVRDEQGLSEQEKELLRLWASGATDEKASRQLGVSARTVRRLSGDLMGRLGANSRFQAGAKAMERGWLSPTDLA